MLLNEAQALFKSVHLGLCILRRPTQKWVHPRRQVLPFQEINKKNNSLMAASVFITPRVPWTARRSKQSILKEISPEYSLEGLMFKVEAPILWPPDVKS